MPRASLHKGENGILTLWNKEGFEREESSPEMSEGCKALSAISEGILTFSGGELMSIESAERFLLHNKMKGRMISSRKDLVRSAGIEGGGEEIEGV